MATYRLQALPKSVNPAFLVTAALLVISIIVPLLFREHMLRLGESLMTSYGQERIDLILYAVTVVSSSPVALPVWTYAAFGSLLGYESMRLVLVMSLGAMTGSSITYFLGRFFAGTGIVRKYFPNVQNHPWTKGRSVWVVSLILFGGAVSPIPFDVMYAACGVKRYPVALFSPILFTAWAIKLSVVVYGFKFAHLIPYLNIAQ